jgi:glycine/D-amino acid oxidase-like deaminating enzyme
MLNLAPVNASYDRIIRVTVGLRPHRNSGFVLRADRLDEKTVIHNYGHGGAGMSLSWGTGAMAADLALQHADRRAAVLGCGVVGLTAARQLQRRGFEVTIYAETLPPYTTSNMSLASFTPTSGLTGPRGRTPEWDAQFRQAVQIAYRELQLMAGGRHGVSWIDEYATSNNESVRAQRDSNTLLPAAVDVGRETFLEGEHPFGSRFARRFPTLRFEPSIYLDELMRDVITFGGSIVVRKFESTRDIALLTENLIVNCTGLGSKTLFGDEELEPVKGQLIALVPQEEVTYATGNMLPRRDGIILGHVMLRGDYSLEVNEEERTRVMESAIRFFGAMRRAGEETGARATAPITIPPVEAFFGRQS